MSKDMSNLIAKAEQMARSDDNEAAMSLANELVARYPDELRVWSLRAHLHGRNRNYSEAVADFTHAIEINAKEPELGLDKGILTAIDLLFNRGADRFALGDHQLAIDDFSKGLTLCNRYNSDDYRETLHFWRAEALLKLGKKAEARSDLAHVSDDFRFWTFKLRTKADLLTDCNDLS